jgi:hypothetical protein
MATSWGWCSCCNNRGPLDAHHQFHQVAWAKKLYGKLLNDPRNIQYACPDCHASHRSTKLIHWTEEQFCTALDIEIRSKTGKIKR